MVEGAQISEKVSLFFCRYNTAEYRTERNERFPSLLIIAEHSLMGQTRKRLQVHPSNAQPRSAYF